MTSAISARTTKLLKNHVVVGEIRGIPSFDPETEMLDATNSDSINSKRELVSGLTLYTFDTMGNLIRSDAGQTALRTAFNTKAKDSYEIVFPADSNTSYEFEAYVSSYAESAPHDDVMTFDASFQVTGDAKVNTTGSAGLTTPYFVITGDSSGAITPTPAAYRLSGNYLDNWSFEKWSSGITSPPDGWTADDVSVERSNEHVVGNYGIRVTGTGSTENWLDYHLNGDALDGKTVTFSCWVKSDHPVHIKIRDDRDTPSNIHSGSGEWELLTVSKTWVKGTIYNEVRLQIPVNTDYVAYFDAAYLTLSSNYSPDYIDEVVPYGPEGTAYEYKAMADTADTSVTITPTAAAGTIYVNGVTVASGVASSSISLGSTDSYINIFIEVKETLKAPKIYLIEIYRP